MTPDDSRPLRVVHVLHSFGLGGMEKGITHCVRLGSPDIEHAIVCLTRSGAAERLLPEGTPVRELHKPPGNSVRAVTRLARELRSLAPCVVHTRNWGGMDGIVAARLAGIRDVFHGDHGWEMDDLYGGDRKRRLVRRTLSRFTRGFTCVSRDLRRWLERDVRVRCPVTQIYNGVDTDTFRPGPDAARLRSELDLPDGAPLIGHVGRLVEVKDHRSLFRAFARLRERHPGAALVCVGEGPDRDVLAPLAPEGAHLLGHRDDVAAVLRALDLFVLCSHNEGISNTVLEAMASGLPVVATRVGGNPELVEDGVCGALVPPRDPEALAAALERYVAEPSLRRAHGEAARTRAVERFSLRAMVEAYEAVWRGVSA